MAPESLLSGAGVAGCTREGLLGARIAARPIAQSWRASPAAEARLLAIWHHALGRNDEGDDPA
ncbi:MAG: hypothetical protein ACI85K_003209 [Hyphomicrobiaceae bacterium]|jgi:hypothetical protein